MQLGQGARLKHSLPVFSYAKQGRDITHAGPQQHPHVPACPPAMCATADCRTGALHQHDVSPCVYLQPLLCFVGEISSDVCVSLSLSILPACSCMSSSWLPPGLGFVYTAATGESCMSLQWCVWHLHPHALPCAPRLFQCWNCAPACCPPLSPVLTANMLCFALLPALACISHTSCPCAHSRSVAEAQLWSSVAAHWVHIWVGNCAAAPFPCVVACTLCGLLWFVQLCL